MEAVCQYTAIKKQEYSGWLLANHGVECLDSTVRRICKVLYYRPIVKYK